ncbi:helix-turn-helix domain-containing protein [Desulfosarcina sp.]|uniref:helix-turn-helix domain-containing protein n=1 Tax=Desulfosarcina sp. TaxID=2027861 RepID=UPI0039B9922E
MTGGNRFQASKLLGMYRPTLHAKIDKYDLNSKPAFDRSSADGINRMVRLCCFGLRFSGGGGYIACSKGRTTDEAQFLP